MRRLGNPSTLEPTQAQIIRLTSVALAISNLLLLSPVIIEMAVLSALSNGEPINVYQGFMSSDYIYWMMGAGSLIGIILAVKNLLMLQNQGDHSLSATFPPTISLLCAGFFALVVADSVLFYYPNKEDTGSINVGLLKEIYPGKITQIPCDGMIPIKDAHSDVATYRCPKNQIIILGRMSSQPLVPWGNYTEGKSEEIPILIKKIMAEAKK